MHSAHFTDGY